MIPLAAKDNKLLSAHHDPGALIGRISTTEKLPETPKADAILLIDNPDAPLPKGYKAYLIRCDSSPAGPLPDNTYLLSPALHHLDTGDIIRITGIDLSIRVLYRIGAFSNALLLTERCNSFCTMCSQPPRKIDDSYLVRQWLKAIPLMDHGTKEIVLTGGEPALLGKGLIDILQALRNHLPSSAIHVLTNGRKFEDLELALQAASIDHPDLMFGIPLYSDVAELHDFVVQARGAFDETLRGILNLKRTRQRVEIRVVIHSDTYARLPMLAEFIVRNLLFVDQVVLMGLERMGFGRSNWNALWIDPYEYREELSSAVNTLNNAGIRVMVYNHPLCVIPNDIQRFAVKSISDWKNEYLPKCNSCSRKHECGGFFSSSKDQCSEHISPYLVDWDKSAAAV